MDLLQQLNESMLQQLNESMRTKKHFAQIRISSQVMGLEDIPTKQPMLQVLSAKFFENQVRSLIDSGQLSCEGFRIEETSSGDSHGIVISVWGYPGAPSPEQLIPRWDGCFWNIESRSGGSLVRVATLYLGHHPKMIVWCNESGLSDQELIELLPS